MKCFCWTMILLSSIFVASSAYAQQPARPEPKPADSMANTPNSSMTPEMWLYLHEERRADDPASAVRRRAEIKAAQREQRLASSKWYGFYNARPSASMVPIMGTYSPTWVGNGWNNYQWISSGNRATNYVGVEYVETRR